MSDSEEKAREAVIAILESERETYREVEASLSKEKLKAAVLKAKLDQALTVLRRAYTVTDELMAWDNNLLDDTRVCLEYKNCVNAQLNLVHDLKLVISDLEKD